MFQIGHESLASTLFLLFSRKPETVYYVFMALKGSLWYTGNGTERVIMIDVPLFNRYFGGLSYRFL